MKVWLWIAAWYGAWSIVTFMAYWRDKRAAQRGLWRTRERTLHVLGFAGGWPGALIAQRVLRHKTRDGTFLVVFWLGVTAHVVVWGVWLWWR